MALQLAVNNPFNGISANGYIKLDTTQVDRVNKRGFIKFVIYQDANTRNSVGKIPFDAFTIWVGGKEEITNGNLVMVNYSDLLDKTTAELYAKIKGYKVQTDRGEILELPSAKDV
jgi:hypothetical protein